LFIAESKIFRNLKKNTQKLKNISFSDKISL